MRRPAAWALALAAAGAAGAQEAPAPPAEPAGGAGEPLLLESPILVIRRDELFEASAFGRASRARARAAADALLAESRALEAAVEAEERALTERRGTMPPEEFRKLAEAFDEKVEGIRAAQIAKDREISDRIAADRQRFLRAAVPVLGRLMRDKGAVVILDQQTVVVNLGVIDVTEEAVARIDAEIGTEAPAAPVPETVPETVPEPAPAPAPGTVPPPGGPPGGPAETPPGTAGPPP